MGPATVLVKISEKRVAKPEPNPAAKIIVHSETTFSIQYRGLVEPDVTFLNSPGHCFRTMRV